MDILKNLGITDLAFGSESAIDYNEIADIYEKEGRKWKVTFNH